MKNRTASTSPQTHARAAGWLYLLVITGGIFEVFVRSALIASGDAATTATNILAHELRYRSGFVAGIIILVINVPLTVIFYDLFKVVNRRVPLLTLVFLSITVVSCGDKAITAVDACRIVALPLTGNANAPTVTDVGLEVQAGGIVVVGTASDPQGSENVRNVLQAIGVFPDGQCDGTAIVLRDDLAESGVEETFGTAVSATGDPTLYDTIAAAVTWPVEVDFADIDGNRTTGRVRARIIR